jgi:hypothetical protein
MVAHLRTVKEKLEKMDFQKVKQSQEFGIKRKE